MTRRSSQIEAEHAADTLEKPRFVAVDWGTSRHRAYLVSNKLECLEESKSGDGIGTGMKSFSDILKSSIGVWRDKYPDIPVVLSGMVGSRGGWQEVPYLQCPVGATEIAAALEVLRSDGWPGVSIVPGVQCSSALRSIDLMRGEEIQVVGAIEVCRKRQKAPPSAFCIPGTHSKWVSVTEAKITSFSTAMTGEVYGLLKQQSLLRESVERDGEFEADLFIEGIKRSGETGGLLHHLFSVRTLQLTGHHPNRGGSAYLSGILIGHELRSLGHVVDSEVVVVSSEKLFHRYRIALEQLGHRPMLVSDKEATIAGVASVLQYL